MSGLDLDMGRYGGYIWPAFAVTAVVLAALVIEALLRSRRWRREVERRESEAPDSGGSRRVGLKNEAG